MYATLLSGTVWTTLTIPQELDPFRVQKKGRHVMWGLLSVFSKRLATLLTVYTHLCLQRRTGS